MEKPESLSPEYFEQLCRDFLPKDRHLTIIEVGTWKGASAFHMINGCEKNCTMYCVDTWLGSVEHYNNVTRDEDGYPCIFKEFWNNVKKANFQDIIKPITLPSQEAASILKSKNVMADFIYIDASHDFKNVKADMESYWQLLKPGGVLFGDDFNPSWYGVMGAVQMFSFERGIQFKQIGTTWFITKNVDPM